MRSLRQQGSLAVTLSVAVAVAGLVAFLGWRWLDVRADLAEVKVALAIERADANQAASDAQAEYRLLEAAMQTVKEDAENAARLDRARLERRAAADRVELDRVRDELAAFASSGGDAASDTLNACRARAAELGSAVDDGLRVQAAMAEAFANLAVDYRSLHLTCSAALRPELDGPGRHRR